MPSVFTLQANDVFDGSVTVGAGDTGQIALTHTGTVEFNSSFAPQPISFLEITKDLLSQGTNYSGVTLESVTVTAVTPNASFSLTTADLPPDTSFPVGFPSTITATGTVIDVSAVTSAGTFAGSAAVIGTDGNLVLVGDVNINLGFFGTINAGAAVLSSGTQNVDLNLDNVTETFTPAFTVACFAEGARLLGELGEVAVESLAVGDRLATGSGRLAVIRWLGHREVNCAAHPDPETVWPVRVRAGAFGAGMPHADLLLSPDHAVFTEDVLIPVRYLINGTSIAQEPRDTITYWHVELDRHDVLLAQGLPAESYLDTGNRAAFAGDAATQLHPVFAGTAWDERACAPLVLGGPPLARARAALAGRIAAPALVAAHS